MGKIQILSGALEANQTISTCGNHDLDSRYLATEVDPDPRGFLLSLKPPFPFNNELLNDRYWARNYAITTLPNGVVIVSLNSSAFHGGKPEEIDHGRVSRRTIDALAAELAGKSLHANQVQVFIRTSPFKRDNPQYSRAINVPLVSLTSDTLTLVDSALFGLRQIYREGFRYAKAGVLLHELQSTSIEHGELFGRDASRRRR
jgi:hypothetical protein